MNSQKPEHSRTILGVERTWIIMSVEIILSVLQERNWCSSTRKTRQISMDTLPLLGSIIAGVDASVVPNEKPV
jgi:hypothetical protein